MKNPTLPKALAVEQTQENFMSHFTNLFFVCILYLLETDTVQLELDLVKQKQKEKN